MPGALAPASFSLIARVALARTEGPRLKEAARAADIPSVMTEPNQTRTGPRRLSAASFLVRRERPERNGPIELHVCPLCSSELVYPEDWSSAPNRRWNVSLRCPDCEWHGVGVFEQSVVDRFDEALDRGTGALLDDLGLLTRVNMEEEIDLFAAALWADRILPEDF